MFRTLCGLKVVLIGCIVLSVFLIFRFNEIGFKNSPGESRQLLLKESVDEVVFDQSAYDVKHDNVVKNYFKKREILKFTNLGKVLFLNESPPPKKSKIFKIMIYKTGLEMEKRHLYFYGNVRHDPFEDCSVDNCILTYDSDDFQNADAVLFHLHRFSSTFNVPKDVPRPSLQRWIFLSDESPQNTFLLQPNHWYNYSGVFNWSMTLRLESDIPVAAGRILPLKNPQKIPREWNFKKKFEKLVPFAKDKRRDVLVAIMSSNCHANGRKKYVEELQQYLAVDVYGGCAPKHLRKLCPWKGYGESCQELRKYLFYLSFENSNCNGYVTEKVYTQAIRMGSIPVYMGMYEQELDLLVPPNSYLHVDNFKSAKDLAKFILHINATLEENYLKYHEWRRDFESLSEDGYMGAKSYHYCRICEALNFNDEKPKIYEKKDLAYFLNPKSNCHAPTW